MSDIEQRLQEIDERASDYAHFVGIYGRNDGGDDRAFLLALVRKYREVDTTILESVRRHSLANPRLIADKLESALTYNPNESEAKK